MLRREDDGLLRGQGNYIDDVRIKGTVHGLVLRAPIAHGTISAIDVEAARTMPGVLDILTGPLLEELGIGPIQCRTPVTGLNEAPMHEPRRPVLAVDQVKFAGQPVAFVVAETAAQAADALEAIEIDYDELPSAVTPEDAAAEGAPLIWSDAPGNSCFKWEIGNDAEVDQAFRTAPHVVCETVHHPRVVIAPVEPRGAVGQYDPDTDSYTLNAPSQGVVLIRTIIAQVLGIETQKLRVITGNVGGSFAVKIFPYPEHALCLIAAKRVGRPVKWVATGSESFLADSHGRGRVDRATLALDEKGNLLAFRIDALADLGAFASAGGPMTASRGAVRTFANIYKVPALHYTVDVLYTNAPPVDAFRGAGKPETTCTLERLIDLACYRFGFDPLEIRRQNLIRPEDMPYKMVIGETYDNADLPAVLDQALALADWSGFGARRAESEARGLKRGIGIGLHAHQTGGSRDERSEVRALPDGRIRVRTGMQDSGQGHQDALAQIAAEALGLSAGDVIVEQGDSQWLEVGGGTGGSNLMPIAAPTVHRAALAMVEKGRELAADMLETARADIEYTQGSFAVAGTDRKVSFAEIAARFPEIPADAAEPEPGAGCVGELDFEGEHATFPNGCYIAEVELDPETGKLRLDRFSGVDDLGRLVNPVTADGQIVGGAVHGLAEVLFEGAVFDRDSGQLTTGSLMDYHILRADEVPSIPIEWAFTDAPNNILNVKGAGEVGTLGAPAAVNNAAHHALLDLGVEHVDIPLTPEKVWRAIQDANA